MQGFGGLLFFLGIGSFVLKYMGREFTLLMWVDNWGRTVGNVIRIAMILVGAILWFIAMQANKAGEPEQEQG